MPTILIVDDAPPILMALEAVLKLDGYTVHTAPEPVESLPLFDREQPDLVLLDINFGSTGQTAGLDLLRLMRDRRPTILVVMVSGYLDPPTREAALTAGAVDCWPKPIALQTLRNGVAQVLGSQTRKSDSATSQTAGGPAGHAA